MRTGLSTGTYAAALAKASVCLLLGKAKRLKSIWVLLPDKRWVRVVLTKARLLSSHKAVAWAKKDAGDDPDVTHKMTLGCLALLREDKQIVFKRGKGIGVITRPGLPLPIGEVAINPSVRRLIAKNLHNLSTAGVELTFMAPLGERIALKTFNPRLGIKGGISLLGTTGRVRPFSKEAIRKTIELHLNSLLAQKINPLVLVAGNLGKKAALKLEFSAEHIVEVGNDWQTAFSFLEGKEVKDLVILSHPGKLLKFLSKEFYTHSKYSSSALKSLASYGFNPDSFNTVEEFFLTLDNPDIIHKMLKDVKKSILDNFNLMVNSLRVYFINYNSEIIAYA